MNLRCFRPRHPLFLLVGLGSGLLAGCDLFSGPDSAPTTIELSPSTVSFDALGAEEAIVARVLDQHGREMPEAAIEWTSPDPEVATISDAGLIISVGNGTTTVTATAGNVTEGVEVSVEQRVEALEVEGGGDQTGAAGSPLPEPLIVRAFDPRGHPAIGAGITFSVEEGGGSVSDATATTDGDGRAATTWTLGTTAGEGQRVRGESEVDAEVAVEFQATAISGPPAHILMVSGNDQSAVRLALLSAPLIVRVEDAYGNAAAGVPVEFAVEEGGGTVSPSRMNTNSSGLAGTEWTLGPDVGPQTVTASIEGGASVTFTAEASAGGDPGAFRIELEFLDEPTPNQRSAFESAVARWESVVVGSLQPLHMVEEGGQCGERSPDMDRTVDDLLIFVTLEEIDGPGGTAGRAGLCWVRTSGSLPIVGRLQLDVDDLPQLESLGLLEVVILHEIGHVLGIGTLWGRMGLLRNPSLPDNVGADTHFSGAWAINAFDAIGGESYEGGEKVPVENEMGGQGTRDVHWRGSVFDNELMTGFVSAGSNPLSRVTIASLRDLGYDVDESGADPFTLDPPAGVPGAVAAPGERPHLHLGDDILRGPVRRVGGNDRLGDALDR